MILRYSEILEQIEHAKKKSFHSLIQTYSLSRSFLYFIEKLPLTLMGLYFNSKKNNHWSTQESKKILQLLNELVLLIKKDSDRISNGIYPNDVLRPELSNQMVLGSVKLWIKGLVQIVKTSKHRGANSKFSNSKYVNLNLLFSEDEPANIKNLKLIYDYQFEVIFLGAMDAMRRMLLAPLKKQFRYSEGEGLNILELGCGSGRFTYFLKIAFPKAKVIVIESDDDLLAQAQSHLGRTKGLNFLNGDAQDLSFRDHQFDVVVSSFFLSTLNLDSRRRVISECNRVLVPNGVFGVVDFIQVEDKKEFAWALHHFNEEVSNPNFDSYFRNSVEGSLSHNGFQELGQDQGFLAKSLLYKKN